MKPTPSLPLIYEDPERIPAEPCLESLFGSREKIYQGSIGGRPTQPAIESLGNIDIIVVYHTRSRGRGVLDNRRWAGRHQRSERSKIGRGFLDWDEFRLGRKVNLDRMQ